jgi:hypothetical protein
VKRAVSLSLAIVIATGVMPLARANGWSWSSLNPFASKKEPASPPKKPNSNSSSVPQLNGKPIHPPSAAPAQPSMLSKVGSAPSAMWSKTKQAFSPSSKPAPSANSKLGLGAQPKKTAATTGTGPSWNPFTSKTTATEPPHTTSEFIGLPRPTP